MDSVNFTVSDFPIPNEAAEKVGCFFTAFYQNKKHEDCSLAVFAVVAAIATAYFSWAAELAYRCAEDTRRDGLIDSAFETKIANIESSGYLIQMKLRRELVDYCPIFTKIVSVQPNPWNRC